MGGSDGRWGAAGCAVGRALVVQIAEAALATPADDRPLARLAQIDQECGAVLRVDLGPDRQAEDDVGTVPAGALAAHPVLPALGLEVLLVAIVDERVEVGIGHRDHVAAAAAVAAVRSAELDELLAPEAAGAVAAVAALHPDLGRIEEPHGDPSGALRPPTGRRTRTVTRRRAAPARS